MPTALVLLVYALAVARVTRLVNSDRITERPREWLLDRVWTRAWMPWAAIEHPEEDEHMQRNRARHMGSAARADGAEPPLLAYLVACPWCVSIYVGAAAAPLVWFWGSSPWLAIPALALAFSQATGLMATKGE
jgi:hypothetical protein